MSAEAKPTTYSISELAQELDVTTRTIRFYEEQGLLAPSRRGQERIYSPRDRVTLKLILRGKRLGLSLAEIGELIGMYDGVRNSVPQLRRFMDVLDVRRRAFEQQREDIAAVLDEIGMLERQCRALLAENPAGAAEARAELAARVNLNENT